ncbi:MAG: OmpA family protein [Saprospiraceae bacterium]|nr:OmpA family protein [Saprospiraceae bacterium]
MRNLFFAILAALISISQLSGQTPAPNLKKSYFQISPRAGYDFPTYYNNTPYIDYKGGLELGLSLDYYWNWIGVGADFDYIKNKPKSTFPTVNLVDINDQPITSFSLTEKGITRMFYGVGPSFKFQTDDAKLTAELNLRGGLGSIKGGYTELRETTTGSNMLLNFHAGYQESMALSAKGQLRINYFVNDWFGLHVGGYYLRHFNATESFDNTIGASAGYNPFIVDDRNMNVLASGPVLRKEPCDCDISSIGAFAGVSFRLMPGTKKAKSTCNTCDRYSLAVTARDKFTKEVLPNTDVVLKDMSGNIVKTATTNSYGVVVFEDCKPNNYAIEGALYGKALDANSVNESEFIANKTIQKEIIYSDLNFILKGKTVICNTTQPLDQVSVILRNQSAAEQFNTVTNASGEFIFNLKQQSTYLIHGKKAGYLSQVETVSTKDYNRSTTLFVKLEICMDDAECGKAIRLDNIYYDLDDHLLRPEAKLELDKVVQFMNDYPEVKIELYSHTDSRGSNDYNQKLSQRRANSAVDYIASNGIAAGRLTGIGYGETKLLNRCADGVSCSESEHQQNRRTEVKVICPR